MCALVTGVHTCALPIYGVCCMGYLICDPWSPCQATSPSRLPGSAFGQVLRRTAVPAARLDSAAAGCVVDYSDWTTALASLIAASLRCGMVSCRHFLFAASIELPVSLSGIGMVAPERSEEHTSELQSLMRISYAVFCLQKKKYPITTTT